MSGALRSSEARSLALLMEIAAGTPAGPALLRAQAAGFPRRLRHAAESAADAWERGEELPASLRGAASPQSSARAAAAQELCDAVDRDAFRSAWAPVLTASFALAACSAALAFTAPSVHQLLDETAPVLGSARPGPLLAWLAGHAGLVLACGLLAALALAFALPAGRHLARFARGGALAARIPGLRSLQAALAAHGFTSRLLAALEEGRPAHEAAMRSAELATSPWARERLLACARKLAAGEAPSEAFADPHLPHLNPLKLSLLTGNGGVASARESLGLSELAAREAGVRVGRGLTLAALALTAAVAILLVSAVLLPLATFGAPLP